MYGRRIVMYSCLAQPASPWPPYLRTVFRQILYNARVLVKVTWIGLQMCFAITFSLFRHHSFIGFVSSASTSRRQERADDRLHVSGPAHPGPC